MIRADGWILLNMCSRRFAPFTLAMARTRNVAVALKHREDRRFLRAAPTLVVADVVAGLSADPRFIAVDNALEHRLLLARCHREANAVNKEKRQLVRNARLPHDLQRAHAFLRNRHEPEGQAPVTQGDAGLFVNGADANGELFLAAPALPQETLVTLASGFVFQLEDFNVAAVNAARGAAPAGAFEEFNCRQFV